MKCLILAAGYATRLYPLTENFPKPLLKVKGKTIIDWLIEDIISFDEINEFIVVSNHKFVNEFNNWKKTQTYLVPITIIDDGTISNENRLGAVKDIELAVNKLNIKEDLMIIAGDNLLDFTLQEFIKYYHDKQCSCVMRYYEENLERVKKSAEVIVDSNDLVIEMNEKPKNPKSHWCCPPFYIYKSFDIAKISQAINDGCKKDAPGSLAEYLANKTNIYAMEMPGRRYDIGTIENYKMICKTYSNYKEYK